MQKMEWKNVLAAAALSGAMAVSAGCDREQPQAAAPAPAVAVQGAPLDSASKTATEPAPLPIPPLDNTAPAAGTADTAPPNGTLEIVKPEREPTASAASNTLADAAAKAAADAEQRAANGASGGSGGEKPATAAEATDDALAAHKARLASQPMPKALAGYEPVRFDRLAGYIFLEDPPPAPGSEPPLDSEGKPRKLGDDQIPPEVKALDGKRVTLRGHMIPIDFHKFSTNEFILVQAVPDCYFCSQPMPNEWIEVKTPDGKRVPYAGDEAVTVAGTLRIGAVFKGRYLESLYRLELDQIVE